MSAGSDEIVRELHIEATPAQVFPYFVDPGKLLAWKAVSAEAEARPGGRFRMDVTGRGDVAVGSYLEVSPPHRVVFTWSWEGEAVGDRTRPGLAVPLRAHACGDRGTPGRVRHDLHHAPGRGVHAGLLPAGP